MYVSLRRAAGMLAIVIFMALPAIGANIANLQLVVASPDPVQAGNRLNFQVIVVNAGTITWEPGDFMIEVELYDLQKNYLLKSERVKGDKQVAPGRKALLFTPIAIPEYFSGIYYYRIFVIHGSERIYTGKHTPLRVNPLPILPPKPPTVKLGGNAIFSYKSDTSNDWNDYTGNISLNLVGRVVDRSILFNLYTIHDQDDAVDVYTILLNYYGSRVRIVLGDILPEFSELSVYGTGMRGLSWEHEAGRYQTTLIGARLVESEEGSSDTNGVYRRMLYAGKEEISLPWGFSSCLQAAYGADIESSVEIAGPTITPEKNTVFGGVIEWGALSFLSMKGQFSSSKWFEDSTSTRTALSDSAFRGDVDLETDNYILSAYYQRTGPDFVTFGAPEANSDRITMDMNTELYLFDFWTLSGGYNKFFDDLDDDPNVVRTTQQITSGGTSFNFRFGTGLSAGFSQNDVVGELREIQDNATKTMTYGASQSLWGQSFSFTHQVSEFRDKTNPDSDLDTVTDSINFNCILGSRLSGSIGVSLTENKDLALLTTETNDSYSVSLSHVVIQDKLTLQMWGTQTTIKNSDLSEDSAESDGNIEMTYVWKKNVSITAGASATSFADEMDPTVNTHKTGANIRINCSF